VPRRHNRLADRDAVTGEQVELPAVLDKPSGSSQLTVDQHAGVLFRR